MVKQERTIQRHRQHRTQDTTLLFNIYIILKKKAFVPDL